MQQTQVHPQMYPQQQVPHPQPQMLQQQQQWQQQPQQFQQQQLIQQPAQLQPQPQLQPQLRQQLQTQPQMMYAAQQPQQPAPTERPGFNKKIVYILGIIQIVLGSACIVLQAIAIGTHSGLYFVGHGIWCSVFYIIAGGLSVGASKSLNSCMIVSSMVLCILAAIFAGIHLCFSAGSIPHVLQNYYWQDRHIATGPAVFLQVLAILISLAEMIAAIATSIYDCKTTCCSTPTQNGQTYHPVQYVNMSDGQTVPVVILGPNTTPGQPIMIDPGMVMPQQQPAVSAVSTNVQAEAPPAYHTLASTAPQGNKEQL